jgi:hypothetical protein
MSGDMNLSEILSKKEREHLSTWLSGTYMDVLDPEVYEKLFEHFSSEMPYGTQKARDGDPYEWIHNRLQV